MCYHNPNNECSTQSSGVHLKTLDVYVLIFKRIGMERLARDLSIYSMGLFPLVGHSAMSVRPKLLGKCNKFMA